MDILVSSNLERLIYRIAGDDAQATAEFMKDLSEKGVYSITDKQKSELKDFASGYSSEEDCAAVIRKIYEEDKYVIDTHTSVAASVYEKYREETKDETPTVIASTASPYKFARSVLKAIDTKYDSHTDMEQFDDLKEVSGTPIPNAIEELRSAEVRHKTVVDKDEMQKAVRNVLGL